MKRLTLTLLPALLLAIQPFITDAQQAVKEITLKDVISGRTFRPKGVYGLTPMKDGENYCLLENDTIKVFSYKSGDLINALVTRAELVPKGDTVPIEFNSFTFSADEKKILVPVATEYIYRYSSVSDFYIWDLEKKELQPLSTEGKQRLAEFSPDGTKVAFVRDNDLFIKDLQSKAEVKATTDGLQNNIINGTTDWVYEEEFAITKGFLWSPDGNRIAYYRFDESKVPEFSMMEWGKLYPEVKKFKYPKAGEDNSVVSVKIYNVKTQQIVDVDLGTQQDQYIPRFFWTKNPGALAVLRLNRLQNHLDILLADAATGKSRIIYAEDNQYYIEETNYEHIMFIDSLHYLMTSEKSGNYHIYMMNLDATEGVQLTSGKWDVADVLGYDRANGLVYFSAGYSSPVNREIMSVDLRGKIEKISREEGINNAEFSTNYQYYVNTFSDANTPPLITVNKANGKEARVLEDNAGLRKTIGEYGFTKTEFFKFTTSEGIELNGWKILPQGFDPAKKYPVFMYVYGGPGSQTVLNSWGYSQLAWFELLAQKGYIIASVDNRGTGGRGEQFKKMTYINLGKYETIDQIEAAKYFRSLPYVDSARIGIWGWSYGGYMSALCITLGADYFKAAIAVAPVTNWRYYDNIYTERFMRKPQDNAAGYDDNSPINHVDKLKGKFLIIHGTGDDNVHVQNSMDMISALENANKPFEMLLYPNKNHGIYGGNARIHLYSKMTDFILKNL